MLTNITLENFKAFQKLDNLQIKPITILCGTNSCGKSSILQSILMLKQTLENKNPNQNLLLNGRFVKLGYFQDVIFRKKEENEVKIVLDFFNGSDNVLGYSVWGYKETVYNDAYSYNYLTHIDIGLKIIGKEKSVQLSSLKLYLNAIGQLGNENLAHIEISHLKNDLYNITWKHIQINGLSQGEAKLKLDFSNLFLFKLDIAKENNKERLDINKKFANLNNIFATVNDVLKDIYAQYSYIGPLRGEPEREYIYRDEVREIGNKGENAAFLYLSEREKQIKNHFFYNLTNDNFEKNENISLKDALNQWLTLMKIQNFDAEIIHRIIYLSQNASKFDTTKVGIADVGFGVSQIFPIVLEGLRLQNGGTLLLEQPEIHLHPNLQMQMADYFIALALSGKRVMIETHSDHIINRLVRRIVEDEKHHLRNLIGIYFIKPSENGSVYEPIVVDDTKGIVNWPTDFFDQTATEQMRIMQAGLKKRKNQRNYTKNL
jgi:predicted ATPase